MRKILLFSLLIIGGWYSFGLSSILQADRAKHRPFLRLRLRSNVHADAQVFFDTGHGIQPEEVATETLSVGDTWRDYDFPLPAASIKFLRFDPLPTNGEVTMQSAVVMDYKHRRLRTLPLQDFAPLAQVQSLQIIPAGLQIVTENPAPDPSIGIRLDPALDLSGPELSAATSRTKAIVWHTLFFLLVLGVTGWLAARLLRQGTNDSPGLLLPSGEGLRRFPVGIYFYLVSALVVSLIEFNAFEQSLLRFLDS